jgi:hypothetical protein
MTINPNSLFSGKFWIAIPENKNAKPGKGIETFQINEATFFEAASFRISLFDRTRYLFIAILRVVRVPSACVMIMIYVPDARL